MNPFSSLGLGSELVSALTDQGYENPTPIQAAAIPKALAGHDLLAAAQTGTGKTAAFMLPSLERLKRYATSSTSPAMHPVRMLVLTPTRELADQIDQNVQAYIKNLPLRHTVLFGGVNMDKQTADLRAGCEIVVATVGRLLDHFKQKNINLNKVEIVVLDEADRMLDMGFIDDIRKIMQMLPKQRQTLLFSATFSPPIRKLAQDFMHTPEMVEVAAQNTTNANVEQHIIAVDALKKRNLLERLIVDLHMNQVIVFCKTNKASIKLPATSYAATLPRNPSTAINPNKADWKPSTPLKNVHYAFWLPLTLPHAAWILPSCLSSSTTSCQPNLKTTSTASDVPAGPVLTALPFP